MVKCNTKIKLIMKNKYAKSPLMTRVIISKSMKKLKIKRIEIFKPTAKQKKNKKFISFI